jgi:putative transposase
MNKSQYNPEKHHRRSIRLKGHDYAGGGVYFVTLCAHRELVEACNGNPFGAMRNLIEERMRITAEKFPMMQWGATAIMPDHFHALIRIRKGGHLTLGDLLGGFKAAVSREWRKRLRLQEGEAGLQEGEAGLQEGEAGLARTGGIYPAPHSAPHFALRIWHRNYYEMIVRSKEAEEKIANYIRMNPWKLVQHATHEGQAFRMIGNPALLNCEKIALLCSRKAPPDVLAAAVRRAEQAGANCCFVSGFHSPPEKMILAALLRSNARLICCPAWGIDTLRIPPDWLPVLENNRMLILEMRNREGDLAAAEARNRFVLQQADKRWLPHITPGGMLHRLVRAGLVSAPTPRIQPNLNTRGTHEKNAQ